MSTSRAAAPAPPVRVCPGVAFKGGAPGLTAAERRLVCGDPDSEGWREIPRAQARRYLRVFLQQRGYHDPVFTDSPDALVAEAGPLSLIRRLEASVLVRFSRRGARVELVENLSALGGDVEADLRGGGGSGRAAFVPPFVRNATLEFGRLALRAEGLRAAGRLFASASPDCSRVRRAGPWKARKRLLTGEFTRPTWSAPPRRAQLRPQGPLGRPAGRGQARGGGRGPAAITNAPKGTGARFARSCSFIFDSPWGPAAIKNAPKGNRTPVSALKGPRPNR